MHFSDFIFREQDEQAFNPTHLDMKIVECTVSSTIYIRSLLRGRAAGSHSLPRLSKDG